MSVESVYEGLNRGFVDMPYVGGRLTGFAAGNHSLWVYEAEGVDHDFALDGLNGVNDDCYRARVQRLKRLLGMQSVLSKPRKMKRKHLLSVDIDTR